MFSGTITALVTPFRNDTFDDAAFAALIEAQIAAGIDGIVPVGTTGESPTLDHEEHLHVIRRAVELAAGRCKVIAGTGSNATREAIALTVEAEKAGADAALLVAPYYNKPSQEGLFRHYQAIAAATRLPLMLYSIPGRCGIEIALETVVRLAAACPTIVSLKEAGGSVDRLSALRAVLPPPFTLLSGDDSLTLPFLAAGADGVVSVASNLIPAAVAALVRAARATSPSSKTSSSNPTPSPSNTPSPSRAARRAKCARPSARWPPPPPPASKPPSATSTSCPRCPPHSASSSTAPAAAWAPPCSPAPRPTPPSPSPPRSTSATTSPPPCPGATR
jgi:4-hydroxy-tetrahydrodipicolinate synthase